MSYEKMEVVNPAEKEASEVLHSLLSVERRSVDSKEAIIVTLPSDQNGGGEYGEGAQWHTPMGQHSVFEMSSQGIQQHNFNGHQEQVLWQGHTIQVENGASLQALPGTYTMEFGPHIETGDLDVDKKPKMEKKTGKKKKKSESESDEDVLDNKLEDNPAQDNCYRGLNPEAVYRHRLNIAELTKSEHDMYLMGITMASLANPAETSRHKVRRRLRACYVYQGRKVCLEAFLYLENVTHYQLKRIRQHVMTHGVAPRIHGNVGKKPYNTFTLDIYKHATNFLKEYLKQHASSPKDAQPSGDGKKASKTVIIQGDSRKHLFEAYKEYGEILEPGVKLMGYSTFRAFMKDQFPHVKFATKKQDIAKDM
ncbi:Guanine nucleotide exchange factor DBS, partial [Operophtera brumata]